MVEAENVASEHPFQERINYQGNLAPFIQNVCSAYGVGDYQSHQIIPVGYEDFNLSFTTDRGKYFLKVFTKDRTPEDIQRYADIINRVIEAGVNHPRLLQSSNGPVHKVDMNGTQDAVSLFEFIEGNTFFDLGELPTQEEQEQIITQAARINQIDLKPTPLYDSWAITSLPKEYEAKSEHLGTDDKLLVDAALQQFRVVNLEQLPHAFVHGDIIETNVMRGNDGEIWILDFAVANYYPRVQEVAIIISHLFFSEEPQVFKQNYDRAVNLYQEHIQLTDDEIKTLPIFIQAAFAMELLMSNYEKIVNKNNSAENEHFLELGRIGLTNLINPPKIPSF